MKQTILRNMTFLALCLVLSACAGTKDKTPQAPTARAQGEGSARPAPKTAVNYNVDAVNTVLEASGAIEQALAEADAGNPRGAIVELQEVVKRSPKAFLAHHNIGILHERLGETQNARAAYEQALRAEPNYSPALLNLVRLDIRDGSPSAALATANRYLQQNPSNFEHNYARLEALVANRQFDDAVGSIRTLLKSDEANPTLRYYLAKAEYARGRLRLADFIVSESLEIAPEDADALFLRAKIHHALSSDDISLVPGIATTLDEVLRLSPDHVEALWMRGIIFYEANNIDRAEAYFRRVIALSPKLVEGYINLANALKTNNRGQEAEQHLKRAAELSPKNGDVDFAFGTLYFNIELIELPGRQDMDRLKLAKTYFEAAASNWTDKADVALARRFIKTTDDAIETLQMMIDAESLFATPPPEDEETSLTVD